MTTSDVDSIAELVQAACDPLHARIGKIESKLNAADLAVLAKGMAPAIRDHVAAAVAPLAARIAELERALDIRR